MEFFVTWALALGLVVAPGLVNYYVNRYYTPPGTGLAATLELVAASLTLAFGTLVVAVLVTLLVSLGWEDLREEIEAFTQLGLAGYGQDRPIATPGVLSAVSVASMALMALLGAFRVPSRFVR